MWLVNGYRLLLTFYYYRPVADPEGQGTMPMTVLQLLSATANETDVRGGTLIEQHTRTAVDHMQSRTHRRTTAYSTGVSWVAFLLFSNGHIHPHKLTLNPLKAKQVQKHKYDVCVDDFCNGST